MTILQRGSGPGWTDVATFPARGGGGPYAWRDCPADRVAVRYRLRFISLNGDTGLSPEITLHGTSDPAPALEVWPQPARNDVIVRIEGGTAGQTLVLTDMSGREHFRRILPGAAASRVLSLPASAFGGSGLYLVTLLDGARSIVRKILFLR